MKVGDGSKPFSLPTGSPAKAAAAAASASESLAGGKLVGGAAARAVDQFEKAATPAFGALLGGARQGAAGVAAAKSASASGMAQAGAALLGRLGAEIGRAESDTRSLLSRAHDLRAGANTAATARSGSDLGKALVDGLATAADTLSKAQTLVAAEASLEFLIGQAGRLLRGDISRDLDAMSHGLESLKSAADGGKAVGQAGLSVASWVAEKEMAEHQETLEGLKQALGGLDNRLKLVLGQIEELRSAEADEQESANSDPGDPLAGAAQSVSEARAAINDLFDP
jgi:hypothetical protein